MFIFLPRQFSILFQTKTVANLHLNPGQRKDRVHKLPLYSVFSYTVGITDCTDMGL